MNRVRVLIALFCMFFLVQISRAQIYEADTMVDVLNLIRTEKFDYILPQAMRENRIDMWVQVMGTKNVEEGHLDPLRLDLGGNTGYIIFTDRGGDKIERAVFGRITPDVRNSGAYDIIERSISEKDLGQFVAERDPKSIAVNFSEWLTIADGISHTDYLRLVNAVGEKYAARFVSADKVITDFRTNRVMSEIVFYGELCKKTVEVMEKAFDIIEPGVTTVSDIARWLRNQNMSGGFGSVIQFGLPGVWSSGGSGDHVIQEGDLVHIDFGLIMMNYRNDIKRIAYVLREGESTLPPEIQETFDEALRAREIFRRNIKVGRTAGETFEILKEKLEEAGYVHNDRQKYDSSVDPEKTQISIDFHGLGHGWGDEAVGPRMSPFSPDRDHLKIPLYNLFVLEYMIYNPTPLLGNGKHIDMAIEDDVTVTERGVEFLYPPIKQIRLIR